MISLKHLSKCPSLKQSSKLDSKTELEFCTDTRKYKNPSAFVAIPGAKTNPLDVIDALLTQGCPLVIYQEGTENQQKATELSQKFPRTEFLMVSDAVTFLQELSHQHIQDWKRQDAHHTVFAISGSNGKTTHKEMLSFILNTIKPGEIVATEKNNNNHLGVPLTLLNVNARTQMVVLELGSNHPGEIKVLCDIATPNAGLTTNIGATHLEFFGTEEKVFEEEAYLYQAVKSVTQGKGFYLINKDDAFLKRLQKFDGCVNYGTSPEAEAKIKFLENGAQISYQGKELVATNDHITGSHNKLNLITCVFIATHFFPEKKEAIISAAKEFKPTKNRSEWIQFQERDVYLDAYNANPSSMKAALTGFKESVEQQGLTLDQACIVLGDMYELGDRTPEYHQELGKFVKESGFKNVYFVGGFAEYYQKGFPQGFARKSSADFKIEYRNGPLKDYKIHFIKGSRGIQLETLFE